MQWCEVHAEHRFWRWLELVPFCTERYAIVAHSLEAISRSTRVSYLFSSRAPTIIPWLMVANQPQLVVRGAWLLDRKGYHAVGGAYQFQPVADIGTPPLCSPVTSQAQLHSNQVAARPPTCATLHWTSKH
jgi:hypothetical protein